MSKFFLYMAWLQALFATVAFANGSHAQQLENVRIVNDWQGVLLKEAFTDIQNQTDYFFTYDSRQIRGVRISSRAENLPLLDVLKFISSETGLRFSITDQLILVDFERDVFDKTMPLKKEINLPSLKRLHQINREVIYQVNVHEIIADKVLKGKVNGPSGEPLIGATVVVKETGQGTITDVDGTFELAVPEEGPVTLVVSYIGYQTMELPLNGQTQINVELVSAATELNEVVVVGYGTQKRSDADGAVSSIGSAAISKFPSASVEQSLVGNVPGVHFVQSSGAPGAGISVRVRGVTSIAGGNEPLYVIDGVPFFNSDVRGLNGLSAINPNDIESVEVLKDAAATAIYGSRGGNGVILITTKSGRGQTSSISYNTWMSIEEPINQIELMNAAQFTEYANRWSANSGRPIPDQEDFLLGANTNWQDEIMGTAFSQNHNLNLSGGSDHHKYYLGLGYLNQDGVVTNSNFERFSLRANMNNKLNEVVSVQTSVFGNHSIQNGVVPAQNNNTFSISKTAIGAALWSYPTIPVMNANGEYSAINSFVENPALYVNEVLDQTTMDRWLASTTLKINLLEGLTNNTRLGVDFINISNDQYFPRTFRIVLGGEGAAIARSRETLNYVAENFLEYNYQLSEHLAVEGVLGVSVQRERTNYSSMEAAGFISDDLLNNAIQAAQNVSIPNTRSTQQSIASLFGRARFIFKDRYILAASIRRDGASVFSETNKIATFPSLSFAWKLHEEAFLKGFEPLSSLKFRASWGKSGNPAIQPYQSLPLGLLTTTSQGAGTGLAVGLAPNLPNRSLSWETTTQTNLGLDFGLLNNRLSGSIDYYLKQTDGALSTVQLAPSAGFNTIIDNVGEVENQGLELSLNALLIDQKDFNFSLGLVLSYNKNEVTKTKDNQDISSTLSDSNGGGSIFNVIRVGEELGSFLGYQFIGLDDTGTPMYLDNNQDGSIDANDFVVIGSPFPDFLYGINATLSFKNLSLFANFQGVSGNEVYNVMQYILTNPSDVEFNRMSNIYEFYPEPGDQLAHLPSDRFVEDASYFRLRTLRLGYQLPISGSFFSGIDFYISGQNLLTITDYSGYDPEVNSLNGNSLNQGIDLSAYPSTKSYTFGLNVKF